MLNLCFVLKYDSDWILVDFPQFYLFFTNFCIPGRLSSKKAGKGTGLIGLYSATGLVQKEKLNLLFTAKFKYVTFDSA